MPELGIVVIAAGKGTRMRSALPKELHQLCGRPMIGHVLAVADALAAAYTVVVLSDEKLGPVREAFGPRYAYAVQHEQLGTGHAVLQARPAVPFTSGEVLVLYGDTPLLRPATAQAVVALRRARGALVGIMSMHVPPPSGYGRIVRNTQGEVTAIVEERNATPEQFAITECNSGVMCFDAGWLWQALDRIPRNLVKGEYYLTDLAEMAVAERGPGAAVAFAADDPTEALGINDRAQLAEAAAVLRGRIAHGFMEAGVTLIDPAATYIDADVTIGRDTIIWPGTLLLGHTQVGTNCQIGPHATLIDATVGDGARVRHMLIDHVNVPSMADVRPHTDITTNDL